MTIPIKALVTQDIMMYECLYKFTKIMDQFVQGLKNLSLFKLIRAFPNLLAYSLTQASLQVMSLSK